MNKKVQYTGTSIKGIIGITGEVVATSEFDGTPLVTIYFADIDQKFTVQACNVEEVE